VVADVEGEWVTVYPDVAAAAAAGDGRE